MTKKEEKQDQKIWEFECYSSLLKKIISKIHGLSTEFIMKLTNDGIHIRVVDISHVCMLDMTIPRKEFYIGYSAVDKKIGYKLKQDLEIGLNTETIQNKFLQLINQYDTVKGHIQDNCLYLNTDNVHSKIQLIDTIGLPDPKMPELELKIEANVSSHASGMLKKFKDTIDYIALIADKTGLYTVVEDDDSNVRINLSDKVKGTGRALYSTNYLNNILDSNINQFKFNTDSPLELKGKIGDNGNYIYLLAPRIEE